MVYITSVLPSPWRSIQISNPCFRGTEGEQEVYRCPAWLQKMSDDRWDEHLVITEDYLLDTIPFLSNGGMHKIKGRLIDNEELCDFA